MHNTAAVHQWEDVIRDCMHTVSLEWLGRRLLPQVFYLLTRAKNNPTIRPLMHNISEMAQDRIKVNIIH